MAPAPPPVSAGSLAPTPHLEAPIARLPTPSSSATPAKPHVHETAPRTREHATHDHAKSPAVAAVPAPVEPTLAASPAAAPTPTPTPAPAPTPTPAPKWSDGSYSGWGRSRHGDIQATVAIENGKIVYVAISVCATRYPCDVIAKLPGQVLERQSPETDFVAGATESTNAFYYAVVEALKKAK